MIPKRHTLQYPAPGTRSGRWGRRGTVLHRSGPTRPLDPTQLLRNIMLESDILSNTQRPGLAVADGDGEGRCCTAPDRRRQRLPH
ncbi:hypothetical protein HBI26_252910, partial [Parastagonospora nodorum]